MNKIKFRDVLEGLILLIMLLFIMIALPIMADFI